MLGGGGGGGAVTELIKYLITELAQKRTGEHCSCLQFKH